MMMSIEGFLLTAESRFLNTAFIANQCGTRTGAEYDVNKADDVRI